MPEHALGGEPASPGVAGGPAWLLAPPPAADGAVVPEGGREDELARARAALAGAAAQLDALAERLTTAGRDDEAAIVATSALMALDPALDGDVRQAVLERGADAGTAIGAAAEAHAAVLAALDEPTLAARADDVRSLGRRAQRLLGAGPAADGTGAAAGAVVVAPDLGPADVAELAEEALAFALAGGGPTTHAAIVARSLGLPMVTGAGEALLAAAAGDEVVVDGDAGTVVLAPDPARREAARAATARRRAARGRAARDRELPATTRDGVTVSVLANVASAAEVAVALDGGAEGVGLLRTELAFLDARDWPTEDEHRRALAPLLAPLAGRTATVRVLDFGGDKTPPFLAGDDRRGIALLLGEPAALDAQLRGILAAAGEARVRLRVLLPLVATVADVAAARAALARAADAVPAAPAALLGAMVETPEAVHVAPALADAADFLSIGTNDLTAAALGRDRFAGGAGRTHDPVVVRLIARTARAARRERVPLEVCGEAASDPRMLPLLVGLGADELSVGAARVGTVRAWVRELGYAETRELVAAAASAADAAAVEALVAPVAGRLASLETGDDGGEGLDGGVGVGALGPQA